MYRPQYHAYLRSDLSMILQGIHLFSNSFNEYEVLSCILKLVKKVPALDCVAKLSFNCQNCAQYEQDQSHLSLLPFLVVFRMLHSLQWHMLYCPSFTLHLSQRKESRIISSVAMNTRRLSHV